MLRTALRPKWLGLFVVMVGLVVAFIQLGAWQLSIARSESQAAAIEEAAARPAAPLDEVFAPHQPFRADLSVRRITASGSYGQGQVVIADRRLDGRTGWWVVAPLQTDAGTIGVLRGWVADAADAPRPPTGQIEVAGALAPGESPLGTRNRPTLPESGAAIDPQLASIDLAVLVQTWHGDLYNAFVFATAESGPGIPSELGLTRVPPPPPIPEGLTWRNAAYALQWWLFAAFAVFMWVRMVREEHRAEVAMQAAADAEEEVGDNGAREPAVLADPRDP